MIRRLGRGPLLAVACLCCLVASACAGSDGDQPSGDPAVSISTTTTSGGDAESGGDAATSSTADGSDPAATTNTGADATASDAATSETTTTTTAEPSTDTTTGAEPSTDTTTGAEPSTDTTTGAEPSTDTTTSAITPEDPPTTTSTTTPAEITVSPWPADPRTAEDREWRVRIEASWSHDTDAFTQGLETGGGIIYESTGLYGESRLRALEGPVELRSVALDPEVFGEGLTLVGDEIIQLSWREGRALRWDRDTFEPRGEFRYDGEGWGICWDGVGSRLLMSDGTSTLTHRNRDFAVVATTTILRDNDPVTRVNELECVAGLVVANIWMSNEIIVIDPDSGEVLVSVDAASLAAEVGLSADERSAVLNGIAYNGDGKWILGGKNWPMQFLVTLSLN